MTKASGANPRPKVAGSVRKEESDLFDFCQSEEWQDVLEKARIQREKSLAQRAATANEPGEAKPKPPQPAQSTPQKTSEESQNWLDRLERARQQREAVLAKPESQSASGVRDSSGAGKDRVVRQEKKQPAGKAGKTGKPAPQISKASRKGRARTEQDQPSKFPALSRLKKSGRPLRDPVPSQTRYDGAKSNGRDPQKLEKGAIRAATAAALSLRRKTRRSQEKQEPQSRLSIPTFVTGCAVGLIASMVAVFVFSGNDLWKQTEGIQGGGQTELAATPPQQGAQDPQLSTRQPASTDETQSAAVQEARPVDAPQRPPQDQPIPSSGTSSNTLASLTPTLPVSPELTAQKEPSIQKPVVTPIQASVKPLIPTEITADVSGVAIQRWVEADDSTHPLRAEVLGAEIIQGGETAAQADRILWLAKEATALPQLPDVTVQLASLNSGDESFLILEQMSADVALAPKARVLTDDSDRPIAASISALEQSDWQEVALSVGSAWKGPVAKAPDTSIETPRAAYFSVGPPVRSARLRPLPEKPFDQATPVAAIPVPHGASVQAKGAAVMLFAPSSLSSDTVEAIARKLEQTGHELNKTARVGFGISQSNVRYYHEQDAAQAAALAKDAGATLRDFTGAKTKTPAGLIELWLAGESVGAAPAKPKPKKSRSTSRSASPAVNLRNQVIQKLRRTTNQ
ncbi:hypothetical protein FGK63_18155 [Ruegeria sediminis]|uniref:SPOR domain-containing protein n=1 Tax=Ruegeria sediminis TaxID=2583820 RepID=A0ABY2WT15_9RHOB|nr:hypothetical protein [Ruegeria sediminis]TMV04211.1 hypothetical protein FGK63_18155 [Ruegeria sediminis]